MVTEADVAKAPYVVNKFKTMDKVRHVATGKEYVIVSGPPHVIMEATGGYGYIYIAAAVGRQPGEPKDVSDAMQPARTAENIKRPWWVRSQEEMEDGRFELVL